MQELQQATHKPGTLTALMPDIVTGPPCSGKSTWVRQRAMQGDSVIDRIAVAIASGDTRGTPIG